MQLFLQEYNIKEAYPTERAAQLKEMKDLLLDSLPDREKNKKQGPLVGNMVWMASITGIGDNDYNIYYDANLKAQSEGIKGKPPAS